MPPFVTQVFVVRHDNPPSHGSARNRTGHSRKKRSDSDTVVRAF